MKVAGQSGFGAALRRGLFLAVALVGALGCSGASDKAEDGASTTQAIVDPNAEEEISIAFSLPAGANLDQVALAASSDLDVGEHSEIKGDLAVAGGDTTVGVGATVGAIRVRERVTLRQRAHVVGDVVGREVDGTRSAIIDGKVTLQPNPPAPTSIAWSVTLASAPLGDAVLQPHQARDLPPGKYGKLYVAPHSSVTLHSGVYWFSELTLQPDATLRVEDRDGPVQVIVKDGFRYHGQIASPAGQLPQIVFNVLGECADIDSPFVGALIAPNAHVRVQGACQSEHVAFIYGAHVSLDPKTKLRRMPFEWTTVLGAGNDAIPPDAIVRNVSDGDLAVSVNIAQDGSGDHASSGSLPSAEPFRLRDKYTVAGGIIGNGTATFRFRLGSGAWTTCIYEGQSSDAAPTTPDELIKGTLLVLQSCSDGLAAGAWRSADQFELSVDPTPGYPVIVDAPLLRPEACDDSMELLTVAQTHEMRSQFNWNSATKVGATNTDGTPALYYAWIYIRNKDEALALKKLYIHVLSEPLFDEELLKFGGRCGTFTNPGDGTGMFVPVLLPGATFNKLIDAQHSSDVKGDRIIFEAVIIRNDVPATVRNSNGSVSLQALKAANFHYLDYETNPFADQAQITLDSAGVSKVLTDVLAWVGQAARDVGESITGVLGDIDQAFRGGGIDVTFHLRAITRDTSFGNQPMVRAWGKYAGNNLGASGMEVKIIQKTAGFIPTSQRADTNINGKAVVEASPGAPSRRSGLCIELRTKAALVTDFLIANKFCDLRGYIDDNDPSTAQEVKKKFKFKFNESTTYDLHIDNTRMSGLYEADDVYRYAKEEMNHEAERARILSGYWAATFAPKNGTRLFTPCLNFPNTLSDAIAATGGGAGAGTGALLASVAPGVGTALGAAVGAIIGTTFAAVVGNSDIVMSLKSDLRRSRGVMSHEYGHYEFCSLLYKANKAAIDHLVWANVVRGDHTEVPLRYTNEAIAEFFMGQVTSGANYHWLPDSHPSDSGDLYCANDTPTCWDSNLYNTATGGDNIGRVATLLQDAFDGHSDDRTGYVPNTANAWQACAEPPVMSPLACTTDADCSGTFVCSGGMCTCNALTYRPTGSYGDPDRTSTTGVPERIHLSGKEINKLTSELAAGLSPFFKYSFDDGRFEEAGNAITNPKVLSALNATMVEAKANWCDRCVVFALHDPELRGSGAAFNAKNVYNACATESTLISALAEAPPEPNLRIQASDCTPCGPGMISDDNGVCQTCSVGEIVGNSCNQCMSDVVLDGNTMDLGTVLDPSVPTAGDNCPDVFWVEIDNPSAIFARGAADFSATTAPQPESQTTCQRQWSLTIAFPDAMTGYYSETTTTTNGSWPPPCPAGEFCLASCETLPVVDLTPQEAMASVVRFGMPNMTQARMLLRGSKNGKPL